MALLSRLQYQAALACYDTSPVTVVSLFAAICCCAASGLWSQPPPGSSVNCTAPGTVATRTPTRGGPAIRECMHCSSGGRAPLHSICVSHTPFAYHAHHLRWHLRSAPQCWPADAETQSSCAPAVLWSCSAVQHSSSRGSCYGLAA
jgi:hypothetical protein